MSYAAKTLMGCAFYILPTGLGLMLIPNILMPLFGVAPTSEVYIRIVGMLLAYLGVYYIDAAKKENRSFMEISVKLRFLSVVIFCGFVLLGLGPTILYLFAAADLIGALLTWRALQAEKKKS